MSFKTSLSPLLHGSQCVPHLGGSISQGLSSALYSLQDQNFSRILILFCIYNILKVYSVDFSLSPGIQTRISNNCPNFSPIYPPQHPLIVHHLGTSLVVQWLRLHASTTGDWGSNPGLQGTWVYTLTRTKIPHAMQCGGGPTPQKKNKRKSIT